MTSKKNAELGHGRGLASVEAALVAAVEDTPQDSAARLFIGDALGVEASAEQVALGVEARGIGAALASCERPAGALLLECQGQVDLALATRHAHKLAGRMELDGREVNAASIADAI